MISILIALRDAGPIEVGTIGPEGIWGPILLVSGEISVHSAIVQAPGAALRIPAPALRQELEGNRSLRLRLGRYAQSFHFQVSQTAACNGAHTVHQRTARWLMLARHRIGSDELPLTQEFLSMMLGVDRPGVTLAAGSLQKAGIIRYARGKITILDPGRLENVAVLLA